MSAEIPGQPEIARIIIDPDEIVYARVQDRCRHCLRTIRRMPGTVRNTDGAPLYYIWVDLDDGLLECPLPETGWEDFTHEPVGMNSPPAGVANDAK